MAHKAHKVPTVPTLTDYDVRKARIAQIREQAAKNLVDHVITPLFVGPVEPNQIGHGEYRGWRCQKPATWTYGFDLFDLGECLLLTGDVGTLVLTYECPMLDWARRSIDDVDYFAEKVVNEIQTQENDPALVLAWVYELDQEILTGEHEPDSGTAKQWLGGVRTRVLLELDDSVESATQYVYQSGIVDGSDLPNFRNWTYRFLWQRECIRKAIELIDNTEVR